MPLIFLRKDITKMKVDAIVNAANSSLLGGGGVDGAIHRAAGPRLLEECRTLGGCRTGQAKATGGYDLPAKHIIHTVGPVWQGGRAGEEQALTNCYINSLSLALSLGCADVAFPLISSGAYGYPKKQALDVAVRAITSFLENEDLTVYLTLFDNPAVLLGKEYDTLSALLQKNEAPKRLFKASGARLLGKSMRANAEEESCEMLAMACAKDISTSLAERLRQLDEGFSTSLLRLIDEKGLTDAQCYKKANVDRKLFSKIRSNPAYRPSKQTALALAIALELNLDETAALLQKAGYALSNAQKGDVIVSYFIERGNFNIFEINEALFAFDQSLLGA